MDGVFGDLPEKSENKGKSVNSERNTIDPSEKTSTNNAGGTHSQFFENLVRELSSNPRIVRIDIFTVTLTGIGTDPTMAKKDPKEES